MSEPLWLEGDPIANGIEEEVEIDFFDGVDHAYEMLMDK